MFSWGCDHLRVGKKSCVFFLYYLLFRFFVNNKKKHHFFQTQPWTIIIVIIQNFTPHAHLRTLTSIDVKHAPSHAWHNTSVTSSQSSFACALNSIWNRILEQPSQAACGRQAGYALENIILQKPATEHCLPRATSAKHAPLVFCLLWEEVEMGILKEKELAKVVV